MRPMADLLRGNLLAVANAYASTRGLKLSSVGLAVRGDSTYFALLAAGERRMIAEVYDDCLQWFADNWPDGAAWPPGVERPEPTPTTGRKTA